MPVNEEKEWKPKIIAFCCNWCSYSGAASVFRAPAVSIRCSYSVPSREVRMA